MTVLITQGVFTLTPRERGPLSCWPESLEMTDLRGILTSVAVSVDPVEAVFSDVLLDGWWDAVGYRAALCDSEPDVCCADVEHRTADVPDLVAGCGELALDLGG